MVPTESVWGSWDAGYRLIEIWSSLLHGGGAGVSRERERGGITVSLLWSKGRKKVGFVERDVSEGFRHLKAQK